MQSEEKVSVVDEQIERAAAAYPAVVTGIYAGCRRPGAVLRWAIEESGSPVCRRLALNFVESLHGACWNALAGCLPADGWLVWYGGNEQEGPCRKQ